MTKSLTKNITIHIEILKKNNWINIWCGPHYIKDFKWSRVLQNQLVYHNNDNDDDDKEKEEEEEGDPLARW